MHLTPWRGNASLYLLQNEVNRLFDGFGSDTEGFAPALDVKEDDKQLTISAELPGVDRNNIEISVRGDVLEIKGHKQEERTEKTDHTYIHERSYGAFTRSLRLPVEVDSDRAEAKMKNGVLELSLPKARGGGHAKTISIN